MKSHLLETKYVILEKIKEAESLIPDSYVPNLMPTELIKNVPAWNDFEHEVWKLGEEIRLVLVGKQLLRSDDDLQREYVRIATNRNAKRGRQSFIMLLGYKACNHHAREIVTQIDDPFVSGHVIDTLYKMQAGGFADLVRPFLNSKITWIRNEAKRYMARFEKG